MTMVGKFVEILSYHALNMRHKLKLLLLGDLDKEVKKRIGNYDIVIEKQRIRDLDESHYDIIFINLDRKMT